MPPAKYPPQQKRALFRFLVPVVVLLALVVSAGLYHIAADPTLFVFRQGGTGATAGNVSDSQFIVQQQKAARWIVKVPVPGPTVKVTVPGPTVTVTKPGPVQTKKVPGPAVTSVVTQNVSVPGPSVTVTVTAAPVATAAAVAAPANTVCPSGCPTSPL